MIKSLLDKFNPGLPIPGALKGIVKALLSSYENLRLFKLLHKGATLVLNRFKRVYLFLSEEEKADFKIACSLIKKNYNPRLGRNYSYFRLSDTIVGICNDIQFIDKQVNMLSAINTKQSHQFTELFTRNAQQFAKLQKEFDKDETDHSNSKGAITNIIGANQTLSISEKQKRIEELFHFTTERGVDLNYSYIILFLIYDMIRYDIVKDRLNEEEKSHYYIRCDDQFTDEMPPNTCLFEKGILLSLGITTYDTKIKPLNADKNQTLKLKDGKGLLKSMKNGTKRIIKEGIASSGHTFEYIKNSIKNGTHIAFKEGSAAAGYALKYSSKFLQFIGESSYFVIKGTTIGAIDVATLAAKFGITLIEATAWLASIGITVVSTGASVAASGASVAASGASVAASGVGLVTKLV